MSSFGGMRSAVTSLAAQSQQLGMIAYNITNVSTIGYKRTSAQISTLVTVASSATSHSTGGVQSNVQRSIDQQGILEVSTSKIELASSGDGFFVVSDASDGSRNIYFTRAGSFKPDKYGNLVNAAGYYLLGWPYLNGVISQTNVLSTFSSINVGNLTTQPAETTTVDLSTNLSAEAVNLDTCDLAIQLFDQQGVSHNVTMTYTKTANPREWTLTGTFTNALYDHAIGVVTVMLGTITFNADGTIGSIAANAGITTLNAGDLVFTVIYDSNLATVANQVALTLNLGTLNIAADSLTNFVGANTLNFIEQNGRQFGWLTGVAVGDDGKVTVQFENGITRDIYQVPPVTLNNANGLAEKSGNVFLETMASGTATAQAANSCGAGEIAPSALESSTVEIADEFTRMIITRCAFSANIRVITTGDEMLGELVRIAR